MRIIAFITFRAGIQKILNHIGVEPEAPRIAPARGQPLREGEGAQESGEGTVAVPPPGRGCACGAPLPLIVVTAA